MVVISTPSVATAKGHDAIDFIQSHCGAADVIIRYAFQNFESSTFTTAGDQLFYLPEVQTVTNQCTLGVDRALTPTAPVLMYHSNTDNVVPFAGVDALYDRWCAYGVDSLEFLVDIGQSDHLNVEFKILPVFSTHVSTAA